MAVDTDKLMNDARCIDKCIPDGEKMAVLISVLYQLLQTGGTGGGGLPTGNQAANTFLAGPATGAPAAATFRSMVTADLGTGLTPQFARVGLGVAADATILLKGAAASAGAGANVVLCQLDVPVSNPFFILGTPGFGTAAFMSFDRSTGRCLLGVYGGSGIFINASNNSGCFGNWDAQSFSVNAVPGVDGVFNGTNTVSVSKGLIVAIA